MSPLVALLINFIPLLKSCEALVFLSNSVLIFLKVITALCAASFAPSISPTNNLPSILPTLNTPVATCDITVISVWNIGTKKFASAILMI